VILGRLMDVQDGELILSDEAAAHVRFADQVSQRMKDDIDAFLVQSGKPLLPLEDDPADETDPRAECASALRQLDLQAAKVSTVIWAAGFTGDFSWLHLPVFDAQGAPIHQNGISPVRGLYFLGFPWLASRKSGIIYGAGDDAQSIAGAISEYIKEVTK
jgi:putative flavoprotein involved in K+ transport